jgi:thiol-disulfide isomerase/thioredoxin
MMRLCQMSLALLCGVCFGGPAEKISIDEVFSTLRAQIQNLHSLEIRSVVTTDTPNSRGKPLREPTPEEKQSFESLPKDFQDHLMKIARNGSIERNELHFLFEGNKFAKYIDRKEWAGSFDDFENASLLVDNHTARAFNGRKYQLLMNGVMHVSSKGTFPGMFPSNPSFLDAFRFARTAETPGEVSLDWLRREETWEELKRHAVITGRQKVGEYSCIVVELVIPNLNSRGKVITRRVYLGEDLGYFPVHYEAMLGDEHTLVNEFEAANIRKFQGPDGKTFHLFGKSTSRVWLTTGKLNHITKTEIDLDNVVYNADIPDSEFNLPLAGVTEYADRDNPNYRFILSDKVALSPAMEPQHAESAVTPGMVSLKGKILNSDGSPAAGIPYSCRSESSLLFLPFNYPTTDPNGGFSIPRVSSNEPLDFWVIPSPDNVQIWTGITPDGKDLLLHLNPEKFLELPPDWKASLYIETSAIKSSHMIVQENISFALSDLRGNEVSLEADTFKGKVILVNIFGSWCGRCNAEIPYLVDIKKKYAGQDFEIIGIAFEDDSGETAKRKVRELVERRNINYPVLFGGQSKKSNVLSTIRGLDTFFGYPTTIFIGRDGKVKNVEVGFVSTTPEMTKWQVNRFEKIIVKLLREGGKKLENSGRS